MILQKLALRLLRKYYFYSYKNWQNQRRELQSAFWGLIGLCLHKKSGETRADCYLHTNFNVKGRPKLM